MNGETIKGFHISSREYYAHERKDKTPQILIGLYRQDGTAEGEFAIRRRNFGFHKQNQLEIPDHAWAVFFDMPELRKLPEMLAATLDEIANFLLERGFHDLTKYTDPDAGKAICARCGERVGDRKA
jgi:hypothetical protein